MFSPLALHTCSDKQIFVLYNIVSLIVIIILTVLVIVAVIIGIGIAVYTIYSA